MSIFKNTRPAMLCSILAAAVVAAVSCAKDPSTSTNEAAKRYFDAWMHVHYPDAQPTGLGIYIIEDTPGTGEPIGDDDYFIFTHYNTYDLDGTVTGTTEEKLAQQIGDFSEANYYGNDILIKNYSYTSVGMLEMMEGMRVGGTRKAVIPGWLNVNESYDTEEDYLKNCTGDDVIVTLTVTGKEEDIYEWEIDTLSRYVAHNMNMDAADSTMYGYYYKQLKEPSDTASMPTDTTFYLNYTGRLLNGKVFDTTNADTAKFYGIYSSSKTYSPVYITMAEDYDEITLSSSSSDSGSTVVDGFAYCLSKLKKYEKGICAFYSELGYSYSGSGQSIPKFAPIVFEVEVVDEPEDDE